MENQANLQQADSRWADKLELVYRQYERSQDLDIALTVVPLSDEEKARMREDQDLVARIAVFDAKQKEEMMLDLYDLAKHAKSESVKLGALKERCRVLYPTRFRETFEGNLNVKSEPLEIALTPQERDKLIADILAKATT